ncbi:MAG: Flp family type IVb pilin [Firmicutes bacterium]|nr:Flp family type IVb pilin [Bacillota bacterium]
MAWLGRWLGRLRRDESGQTMVEYGLIIGVVALIVAGALFTLSGGLKGVFGQVSSCVSSPESSCVSPSP